MPRALIYSLVAMVGAGCAHPKKSGLEEQIQQKDHVAHPQIIAPDSLIAQRQRRYSDVYYLSADSLLRSGDLNGANAHYFDALRNYQILKDNRRVSQVYSGIASTFIGWGNTVAEWYIDQACEVLRDEPKTNDPLDPVNIALRNLDNARQSYRTDPQDAPRYLRMAIDGLEKPDKP